jgi:hypothetical protein
VEEESVERGNKRLAREREWRERTGSPEGVELL